MGILMDQLANFRPHLRNGLGWLIKDLDICISQFANDTGPFKGVVPELITYSFIPPPKITFTTYILALAQIGHGKMKKGAEKDFLLFSTLY